MQDNKIKPGFLYLLMLMAGFIFFLPFCRERTSVKDNNQVGSVLNKISGSEEGVAYISYRSFQNSDKTWGFTVFVNSMPFRHYSRIPYRRSSSGFVSRDEAEKVAALFIKMINNGDHSPMLNRKLIDSLSISLD